MVLSLQQGLQLPVLRLVRLILLLDEVFPLLCPGLLLVLPFLLLETPVSRGVLVYEQLLD